MSTAGPRRRLNKMAVENTLITYIVSGGIWKMKTKTEPENQRSIRNIETTKTYTFCRTLPTLHHIQTMAIENAYIAYCLAGALYYLHFVGS